ncbi:MAG: hypothetical protein EPO42_03665 [Gallionellaceae bacterium]|nr:MAG: hypothetical protein EPO42_03665 [Gallionellaceae bacterium]
MARDIARPAVTRYALRQAWFPPPFHWPPNETFTLRGVSLLALAAPSYGLLGARQTHTEKITIAQLSGLHLGMMLGDKFLERIIARLRELKPGIVVATS